VSLLLVMRLKFGCDQVVEITMKSMKPFCLVIALLLCSIPNLLGQNPELKVLAEEDQAFQRGKNVSRTDQDRGKLVLELLAKGAAQTPEDKFNAALVLQHTPFTFCGRHLVSTSPDNYLLAHYLAKESFETGYNEARVLVAQSIDRYLSMTLGYQKYGTNRINNQKTGKEELVPIDRKTTDAERAKYGVPSLAQLLKSWPEQSKPPAHEKTHKTAK
jgi:hypothetical protein